MRGVEPDGIQPGPNDRRVFSLIITCAACAVSWDSDLDPAECTDDEHEHTAEWKVTPA